MTKYAPDDNTGLSDDELMTELGESYYKKHPFVNFDLKVAPSDFSLEVYIDKNKLETWEEHSLDRLFSVVRENIDSYPHLKDRLKFYKVNKSFRNSEGSKKVTVKMRDKRNQDLALNLKTENTSKQTM